MIALAVIDMQNDFIPGGSLAVNHGHFIIPRINELIKEYDLVIATQDWHPKNHVSFASSHKNQQPFNKKIIHGREETLWPDHCVQGSEGAQFHENINSDLFETIFRKGTDISIDSYSGFYDNHHKKSTGLAGYLRNKKVDEIHLCGLAADFCVYYTAVDALQEGFQVVLYTDATKAIDSNQFEKQLKELQGNKNFYMT